MFHAAQLTSRQPQEMNRGGLHQHNHTQNVHPVFILCHGHGTDDGA
jgi:hypothetical protein